MNTCRVTSPNPNTPTFPPKPRIYMRGLSPQPRLTITPLKIILLLPNGQADRFLLTANFDQSLNLRGIPRRLRAISPRQPHKFSGVGMNQRKTINKHASRCARNGRSSGIAGDLVRHHLHLERRRHHFRNLDHRRRLGRQRLTLHRQQQAEPRRPRLRFPQTPYGFFPNPQRKLRRTLPQAFNLRRSAVHHRHQRQRLLLGRPNPSSPPDSPDTATIAAESITGSTSVSLNGTQSWSLSGGALTGQHSPEPQYLRPHRQHLRRRRVRHLQRAASQRHRRRKASPNPAQALSRPFPAQNSTIPHNDSSGRNHANLPGNTCTL